MTELPNGWAWATIDELAGGSGVTDGPFGSNLKTAHYTATGPRVVRLQNIGDGTFNDERAHISLEHFSRLTKHAVEPGDVLVASLGEVLPRACIAPDSLGPAIVKADCIRIRPHDSVLNPYVMAALNSPDVRKRVGESIKGVGRPRVNLGDLRALRLPIAPFAEQERIVAAVEEAFSKLDAGEAGLRTVRQLLKRMRDAILAAAVTGRLVPQDPSDTPASKLLADLGVEAIEPAGVPALPAGWAWASVESISESVRNGIFVARPPEVPPGVPILRIGAVRRLELDATDVRYARVDLDDPAVARAVVHSGDLLFTRYNGNPDFVGACAVVKQVLGPLLHPDKLIRVVVDRHLAEPDYVAIGASAGFARESIQSATKTTAGQAGISGSDLKQIPIPLPPTSEQTRIAAEVARQFSFLDACERAVHEGLTRSAGLRRSVLKAAFEGKLVQQDPSDEPASVLLDRIRAERAAVPRSKARRARTTA